MHARTLHYSLFIGIVFLATIACNALTRFTRPINQAKTTVQSIETEAGVIKTQGSKIIFVKTKCPLTSGRSFRKATK